MGKVKGILVVIIGGLQKTSLLDYPGKVSAIVFTQGCNFRCPYCHNPELLQTDKINTDFNIHSVLNFLKTRAGKLDGIVVTGGEPCLHKDLPKFLREVKNEGFSVKLDTNGSYPLMIEELLTENILDYIAMDIKAPFDKYKSVAGVNIDIDKIKRSVGIIMAGGVDYEFRTTVLKSMLSFEDFEKIGIDIHGAQRYYLQKFVPTKSLDKRLLGDIESYSQEEFLKICQALRLHVNFVCVR